jgi:hypothetical protein
LTKGAYIQGYDAYWDGIEYAPIDMPLAEKMFWMDGWLDAQEEDNESVSSFDEFDK